MRFLVESHDTWKQRRVLASLDRLEIYDSVYAGPFPFATVQFTFKSEVSRNLLSTNEVVQFNGLRFSCQNLSVRAAHPPEVGPNLINRFV